MDRPAIEVAVIMRKERITGAMSQWQPWRWTLDDVVFQQAGFGEQVRLLMQDAQHERWLFPGFQVQLFKDDAEGYYLNATTPNPGWFVLWRMEEEPSVATYPLAKPEMVSLSYHDAGRWLDAQENVEQIPAPAEVVAWMDSFAREHIVLEPKRRKRPESFRPLTDRFGNPVSISTGKPSRGNDHG